MTAFCNYYACSTNIFIQKTIPYKVTFKLNIIIKNLHGPCSAKVQKHIYTNTANQDCIKIRIECSLLCSDLEQNMTLVIVAFE